jgi:hypothetical protein
MFPRAGVLLALALLVPASAGAETVAVVDPQATVRGIAKEELARCKELWGAALARTGLTTVAVRGKDRAAPAAEFVASLAVDRDGDAVIFTGLATRVRLDRWAARHEARAPFADPAAWAAALDEVAGSLAAAVHGAPPRLAAQPPPRARVKLRHAALAPAAAAAAPAPANAPALAAPAPEAAPASAEDAAPASAEDAAPAPEVAPAPAEDAEPAAEAAPAPEDAEDGATAGAE